MAERRQQQRLWPDVRPGPLQHLYFRRLGKRPIGGLGQYKRCPCGRCHAVEAEHGKFRRRPIHSECPEDRGPRGELELFRQQYPDNPHPKPVCPEIVWCLRNRSASCRIHPHEDHQAMT